MKKFIVVIATLLALHCSSQSVFGYWYGYANVESASSTNNYLIELVLQPEKGKVTGIMNYYFKNTFRSLKVSGTYNKNTRLLLLEKIPVTYHESPANMEVDCIMNFRASLRVTQTGSVLTGTFVGTPDYRYTCVNINFNLNLNADMSKQDSVLKEMREFKETYQLWKPSGFDTLPPQVIVQRKVVNYVKENEFKERENVVAADIEVESDMLQLDFYDNGEIDGDSISVFYNDTLLAFNRRLSTRPLHFDIRLDSLREINEISMFADNLGSIPPNTALMILSDGKNRFEVRLSSTLQSNGTIRIKRKKPAQTSSP
jgi:hypothetical protein